jgi:murein DD-endopeptidase MepM/ murein hydrolase activator NlpD
MILKRGWLYWAAWLLALGLLGLAGYLGWQRIVPGAQNQAGLKPTAIKFEPSDEGAELPVFEATGAQASVRRKAMLNTLIPSRPRSEVVKYTVRSGDSVFGIATKYGIKPETVLWSNYDLLKDDPHSLSPGMALKIPPVDGVYYQWQQGDTLESVADAFEVEADEILTWGGNRLDLTEPAIEPERWVMIPGGQREFQQWIIPVAARGSAGVSNYMYGSGACPGGYEGLYGSGAFVWPTSNHTISGNDYWSGHLAIDIGAGISDPVVAADSGVVMFSGWATGGYGYVVAIDHGNGYQTLYAHLSSVNVNCGQSVKQGQLVGLSGSSGNSSGPHLHFEVRYQGGFVSPWYVLPAP